MLKTIKVIKAITVKVINARNASAWCPRAPGSVAGPS
jgi:hypothetical protein